MALSIGEKIKIIMKRQGMTMAQLADATNQSRQNLSNKMSRDDFSEKEAKAMAVALGCEVETSFKLPDGTII